MGSCWDEDYMVDRSSVPAFVFNPQGNVPTWVAICTKTVGLIDQVCLLVCSTHVMFPGGWVSRPTKYAVFVCSTHSEVCGCGSIDRN